MGQSIYCKFRGVFPLPSINTINSRLRKLKIEPGINKLILGYLIKKIRTLPAKKRVCVLMWDEMAIKPHVTYSIARDLLEGVEDWGKTRTTTVADHAIVFMVRGLDDGWKIPLSYAFCYRQTNTIQLKKYIREHIIVLQKAGVELVGKQHF